MADDYNYGVFDMARENPAFDLFKSKLYVGERAPNFTVEDLDSGEPVELKSLWKNGPAIIEFGSFT
jgi:hypothetical protein